MPGIDRHILFNGNYDLPEHKAPSEIWDNIEIMMIDVPVSMLPKHKAPIQNWDAITAGMEAGASSTKYASMLLSALFLILLFGITADSYVNRNYTSTQDQAESPVLQNNVSGQSPRIDESASAIILNNNNQETNAIVQDALQEAGVQNIAAIPTQDKDYNITENSIIQEETPQRTSGLSFLESKNAGLISSRQIQSFSNQEDFLSRVDETTMYPYDQFRDCNYRRSEHMFGLNAGFEYQYIFDSGIPENTKNKYWYTFDLRVFYQANCFSLETGLGIGFSKDNINFSYNYLTNEIIDTYVYVDSAYYDPISGTTQYFTTTVDVYDSLPYSNKAFVEKKYTYLSIPVVLGYEIIRNKKYTLGLKAGLTYYKEIDLKEIKPDIYHENSRITSLNTMNCERRKEFFTVQGGIEFKWKMSNRFQFTAEPSYRYFLSQVYYVDDKIKGPMSVGLRIGLRYKF